MRALLVGCGAVGGRTARQLLSVGLGGADGAVFDDIVLLDPKPGIASDLATTIGIPSRSVPDSADWAVLAPDVVILGGGCGHITMAERALSIGAHVVSVSDSVEDVQGLLGLDARACQAGRTVVIGAGFAPGLTDILVCHAAAEFDEVDEVHVAKVGTAGPSCARQHHRALASDALDWRDGAWVTHRGGSGRELCWFPDPIGGADCYRAALPDALLLHPLIPTAQRITARVSATRRDRLTARLPMMRKPHLEAGPGAIRVEVRGRKNGMAVVAVMGAMDRPSVAAGAVAALAAGAAVSGRLSRCGADGLGALVADPVAFLAELARRGVKAARFEGNQDR